MQWFLDTVKNKGPGKMTIVGGCSKTGISATGDEISERDVKFQGKGVRCVSNALLNVMDASRTKGKKLTAALGGNTLCDLDDLAGVSQEVFGVSLCRRPQDLQWILTQTRGRFLILQAVHCVGVDCGKRLLYNSARPKVLRLTANALAGCGFSLQGDVDIREVYRKQ
jgi:hypothetical protein